MTSYMCFVFISSNSTIRRAQQESLRPISGSDGNPEKLKWCGKFIENEKLAKSHDI